MAGPEQNRLKLTDDQKKDVLALQKAVDGRFDRVLTAAQKHQIKSVFAPSGPPPGGPGPGDPQQPGKIFSPTQQDTLKLSDGAEETSGGDSEGDRREARDVAHGGPEEAAPGDAATPRRWRAGPRRSPGRAAALPGPSLCDRFSRIRGKGPDTGKNPGRIAAEGARKESRREERLRARPDSRRPRLRKPAGLDDHAAKANKMPRLIPRMLDGEQESATTKATVTPFAGSSRDRSRR